MLIILKIKIPAHFTIAAAIAGCLITYLICTKTSYADVWAGILLGFMVGYGVFCIPWSRK